MFRGIRPKKSPPVQGEPPTPQIIGQTPQAPTVSPQAAAPVANPVAMQAQANPLMHTAGKLVYDQSVAGAFEKAMQTGPVRSYAPDFGDRLGQLNIPANLPPQQIYRQLANGFDVAFSQRNPQAVARYGDLLDEFADAFRPQPKFGRTAPQTSQLPAPVVRTQDRPSQNQSIATPTLSVPIEAIAAAEQSRRNPFVADRDALRIRPSKAKFGSAQFMGKAPLPSAQSESEAALGTVLNAVPSAQRASVFNSALPSVVGQSRQNLTGANLQVLADRAANAARQRSGTNLIYSQTSALPPTIDPGFPALPPGVSPVEYAAQLRQQAGQDPFASLSPLAIPISPVSKAIPEATPKLIGQELPATDQQLLLPGMGNGGNQPPLPSGLPPAPPALPPGLPPNTGGNNGGPNWYDSGQPLPGEVELTPWQRFQRGFTEGKAFQHSRQGDRGAFRGGNIGQGQPRFARSYLMDVLTGKGMPAFEPDNMQQLSLFDAPTPTMPRYNNWDKAGVVAGRIAGDVTGLGTQSITFNMHPLDIASTLTTDAMYRKGATPQQAQTAAWSAAMALGIGSGNWNPLNFAEGGRQEGFRAISADPDDMRQSTNPLMDNLIWRGVFGRTGYLLPYKDFVKERPDVSYEDYEAYQEYLRDPGFLGLFKATPDGINGPEARLMGYRVTPVGAATALGAVGAIMAMRRR